MKHEKEMLITDEETTTRSGQDIFLYKYIISQVQTKGSCCPIHNAVKEQFFLSYLALVSDEQRYAEVKGKHINLKI